MQPDNSYYRTAFRASLSDRRGFTIHMYGFATNRKLDDGLQPNLSPRPGRCRFSLLGRMRPITDRGQRLKLCFSIHQSYS